MPPNVVLILADDLGYSDLTGYGSSFYETPRLDALAGEGAKFTDAYAACPVCSPTRASIMTGKYPARVGVTQWIAGHLVGRLRDVPYFPFLPAEELTLGQALRDEGYATWHVGKWHLGEGRALPENRGFDVNIGGSARGATRSHWSPYHLSALSDSYPGEYLADRLTNEAIRLIERSDGRPFFLNLWHYAVHTPIQAPGHLVAKYREKANALGLDKVDPFEEGDRFPIWQRNELHIQRRRIQSDPVYAAMVENLDWNVGRLLDALEASGQASNTVVIFTSDNGGLATSDGSPTSNAPLLEGKGWTYEGGVRVPLVVRQPGVVPAGTVVAEPVISPDLYPTVLSLAGLPLQPEQHRDGADISALLRGLPASRGPIFWHYPHYSPQGGRPAAAVRDGRSKLVRHFETERRELYDLSVDVSESNDLADADPSTVARLDLLLSDWLADVGALFPKPNPRPFPELPEVTDGKRSRTPV